MNNKHILDLTVRLSQSLDQNYDVVNMDTVLSVITALEGTTITKEQLEATRLAKYINQLRRRTKCENLARRAKSLLKKWREMVGIQQSNESSSGATATVSATSSNNISSTPVASIYTMPVTDNAMTTSHLPNEFGHTQYQRQNQYQTDVKQSHVQQQQPYHSQPSSPVEKSNPNEFLISMSNPATSQLPKSSSTNVRKKKRLDKDSITQQQQPTSFANLLTGLGSSTISSTRKVSREKPETYPSSLKPVETFVIEHSSNSNSDLICLPSNNTVNCSYTSATDVPPVVIDLQDTNSSINSLVSKDITNASTLHKAKAAAKKSKKEKKRKDRSVIPRQNQPLQDCDDQNTTPSSYQSKRTSNVLLLDEKSHSACPTISNISEILSLSNSSISSVFPSTDLISKNFQPGLNNDLPSQSDKISKTELTFAGKFKQNTSTSAGAGCNVLNYNSDSTNVNILSSNSPNQKKISLFGGIAGINTNSNDSTSNSRTSQFNVAVVDATRQEASNSKYNIEDVSPKHISEKSMSNMSNKGNSSMDNTFALGTLNMSNTQQQSIDLTTDYPSDPNVKQPKKRGRKKGSKGVDSVIAKETSLSSQMLISSLSIAGKKVKTTKELYAEMENRKLRNVKGDLAAGNSSTNWNTQTQQKPISSRRASFFSDVAESDSCTMTSEPSRDSGNTLCKNLIKHETTLDNNSNYSKNDTELKTMSDDITKSTITDPNSTLAITTKIKQEIEEFIKNLTPTPSVKEIEYECFKNITPCTCTIEEVVAPTENVANGCDGETNSSTDCNFNVNNEKENDNIKKEKIKNVIDNIKVEEKIQQDSLPPTKEPVKVKKSIFDLDFDEDEDPLNSIIADIAGKKLNAEKEDLKSPPVVVEDMPIKIEIDIGKVELQNTVDNVTVPTNIEDLVVFPSYEVKYDPDCKAKNRFEVQTQKITKFHIDTLHNCFIPNVNGNWNHADIVKSNLNGTLVKSEKLDMGSDCQEHYLTSDGYDVVPFYGSDINEQIVKDLSHVQFTKNFKVKHAKCKNEILFHIPFLGVSRIPEDVGINMQISEYQNLDEEKENINDKLCLKNNFSTSALDDNDGSSNDAKDMEREPNMNDSSNKNLKLLNFKRTKKNATLVKRSTIKRLKLTENGNVDTLSNVKENVTNIDSDSECNGDRSYISNAEDLDVGSGDLNKIEDMNNVIEEQTPHILLNIKKANSPLSPHSKNFIEINQSLKENDQEKHHFDIDDNVEDKVDIEATEYGKRQKRSRRKLIKRKRQKKVHSKLHNNLFYREEIYPIVRFGASMYRECLFQISSCSSDCSADEDRPITRQRTMSSSSSSSSASNISECSNSKYEGQMLNLQKSIIEKELAKRRNINKVEDIDTEVTEIEEDDKTNLVNNNNNDGEDLPEENNGLLLSFNNIYNKSTRENTEQNYDQQKPENKDHENIMLKQQLQKCDDYNNLNNNFNLIKYIDNKTNTVNNNNNNNSFSNSYSDTNIISISSSSSSCNPEKPTNSSAIPPSLNCKNLNNNNDNYKNNDNVQNINPFKEYQTGLRAVDEDVNDDDGNNCGRLQQFKEWHEVLQLRSYNDELLTVLPYVVLE